MQPLDRFALVGGVLRRQTVKLGDAEPLELGEMVAERARLRRAAARAGNLIQPSGSGCPGTPVRG
jgi:hypothetical protein